jgi:hypothetical protein
MSRQIPGSYYKQTEPVQVAPASDIDAVMEALQRAISAGNPPITEQEAAAAPSWVTRARTGVSSWRAFERGTLNWSLDTDMKTGAYCMLPYDPAKGGGWIPGRIPVFTLPADTPISEVVRRAAEVIRDAAEPQSPS